MSGKHSTQQAKTPPTKWLEALGKDSRGSRPRCILLMSGRYDDVAKHLTRLVSFPGVSVWPDDKWMPYGKPVYSYVSWDTTPAKEVELDKPNSLVSPEIQDKLQNWWLIHDKDTAPTLNWDIASTCKIEGKRGLLLVEAKVHGNEWGSQKSYAKNQNLQQIDRAIKHASAGLTLLTGPHWSIRHDKYYQLSNRFAWAWKLASLGVPVVLVYLGFLNAQDMVNNGPLFQSHTDWERILKDYCKNVIDNSCWGNRMDINGTPLIPLIRSTDQPFDPNAC